MIEVPERPVLAPSVQLVGEMQGSGFKDRQWLIQRDGHYIQVTELLYHVAEQVNGERTLREIAAELTERTNWIVTEDHVQLLLQKLIPLELIAMGHGSVALHAKTSSSHQKGSLLSLGIRAQIISPRIITPLAKVFQILYAPPVFIPLLLAIAVTHGWLYLVHINSLSNGFFNFFYSSPEFLFVVMSIMIVSGCFHEFGHASAVQYGGGQARGMGVGFYLLFPVFYADTTDSYQLGRWARVRTALGGFYFHLIFALGLIVLYLVSGQKFLLAGVLLIHLGIIIQCLPFVRLDGYWALTDLTGIPDFFSQMRPFLSSILPLRGKNGSKLPKLKLWVKAIFVLYIILTIPFLVLVFFLLVKIAPHSLANTWDSFVYQAEAFSDMRRQGNVLGIMASVVRMVLLALPAFGLVYMFYYTGLKSFDALWKWSKPSLMRRTAATLAIISIITLVVFLWVQWLPS
jgi:putative peptide zinc metalloprotease protein